MADGGIDIASLGVVFDTTQVADGTKAFNDNVEAGKAMEAQVKKTTAAEAELAKAARQAAGAHSDLAKSMGGQSQALNVLSGSQTKATAGATALGTTAARTAQQVASVGVSAEEAAGSLVRMLPALGPVGLALGAIAVTAGGLYVLWNQGEKAALTYQRAVSGVGRTAGLTADELDRLTHAAAAQGDISIKAAQGQAVAYLRTGQVGKEALGSLIAIGKDYASFMGVDAAQATRDLAKAMEEPDKAARELTRETGLLTQEQIKQIDAAMKAGEASKAQKILLDELTKAVHNHAQQTDEITSAWDAVGKSISSAITKLGEFLYLTKQEKVDRLNASIARAQKTGSSPAFIANTIAERDALQADIDRQTKAAAATSAAAATNQRAQIRADNATKPRAARSPAAPPRDQTEERTAQVEALLARARVEELEASLGLTKNIQARAEIEKQVLAAENAVKQATLARQAAGISDDKGLSQAKKAELLAQLKVVGGIENNAAALQARAIDQATADALAKQAIDIANANRDGEADVLQAQLALATTAQQRGDIEMKLLRLADDQAKATAEGVVAAKGSSETQVAIAQAQLATLEATKSAREAAQQRKTAVAGADEIIDELSQIDALATQAGNSLADAFGNAGDAMGAVLKTLTSFRVQIAQIDKEQLAGSKTAKQAARDRASAELQSYGDMAHAAQGFFKEGSRGYQALQIAEDAYRLIQFANSVKAVFLKGAETAATVTGAATEAGAVAGAEIAKTAATTAGTAVRTPMKVAEGAASMFAALGPLGFPAVAAMIAVMAGLGFAKGGGGVSGPSLSEQRQKTQGTGSVLGDAAAKSDSIAKSLEIVAANTNKDLEYQNPMLKALRSIDANIGALTAQLAKELNVGGSFDTSGLNLGPKTTSPFGFLGNIGNSLFSTKTNTTLLDQGLDLGGSQSLGSLLNGGLDASTYQTTQTTKKKKLFGVVISNRTSTNTDNESLDQSAQAELQRVVESLRDGVLAAASTLGVEGAQATIDSFQVNLGKTSFTGKTGTEIQQELEAEFSKLGDDLAAAAVPGLTDLQKAGEGAFETLARVAREYQVVDISLQSIGKTFGAVGVSSIAARDDLVQLFGSLDDFAAATAQFSDDFLTEAERMAPIQKAVQDELARLGVVGVNTKEQFKQLVLAQDLTTQSGREMYAELLAVGPAFAKVADYLAEGSKDIQDARDALSRAYERESDALGGVIDRFRQFSESLSEFRESLYTGPAALLSPEAQYQAAKSRFEDVSARAKLGDEKALGDLQGVSQAYLDASKSYYASSGVYFADLAKVREAVEASEATATRTADNAEAQLDALKASVAGLIQIDEDVISVHDAIINLTALLAAQAAGANATPFTPASPTGAPTVSGAPANDNPVAAYTPAVDPFQVYEGGGSAGVNPNFDPMTNPGVVGAGGVPFDPEAIRRGYGGGSPQLQMFASGGAFGPGGVVTRPTAFMTGKGPAVAGEGGSEGILPLANIGGKLGVLSSGGSDPELKELLRELLAEARNGNRIAERGIEAIVKTDDANTDKIVRSNDANTTARLTAA